MNAIILSIGDELVLGQTIDTNSAWLSQQLASIGIPVLAHATVGDDQKAIENAIRSAAFRCNVLIISGGIGPTPDDLTRQALAEVLKQPLELNEHWLHFLQDFFKKRGCEMPEMNKIQAMIPRGTEIMLNSCGTAAGIHAELKFPEYLLPTPGARASDEYMERMFGVNYAALRKLSEKDLKWRLQIFVIPGVPSEMKAMFTRDILPVLQKHSGGAVILSKTLHTFGQGESAIAQLLGDLMNRTRNPSVGTTVSNGIVSLRINSRFDSHDKAQQQLNETEQACRSALGDLIFGADDETLPQVVAQLLKSKNQTITTAESCTGGLLAKFLTDIPGSSAYFTHGFITYSNLAKTQLLAVPPNLLEKHGAVSEPVVQSMATGALAAAKSTFALAISGIAGPDGGTPQKPVGTVCIALASLSTHHSSLSTNIFARTFNFPGDRETIRDRSAKMALTILRFHLLGKPLPF